MPIFCVIMLSDPILLILALFTVTLAAALQKLLGFGLGIIAAPILVLIEPAFIPAPILLLGLLLSLLTALQNHRNIALGSIRVALSGRFIGSLLAVLLLLLLPPVFFTLLFSLLIIVSVLLTYSRWQIRYSARNLFIGGFFSGLAGTATSIGGPPIAMVYQNSKLCTVRAELSLFFLCSTIVSLLLLIITGNFSYYQLQLALPLMPAVLLGFVLTGWLEQYFKAHHLKPATALLSLTACLLILLQVANDTV
jgi:uncharacterized protein